MAKSYLIAPLCLLLLQAISTSSLEQEEKEYEILHSKLFSYDEPMSWQERTDLINKLSGIYNSMGDDKTIERRKLKLDMLVWIQDIQLWKCNDIDIGIYQEIVNEFMIFKPNVHPFAKHYHQELMKKCEDPDNWRAIMRSVIEKNLTVGSKTKLEDFAKNLVQAQKGGSVISLPIHEDTIGFATIEYMRQHLDHPVEKYARIGKKKVFYKEYKEVVEDLCTEVNNKLHWVEFRINKSLDRDSLDDFEKTWTGVGMVCYKLLNYERFFRLVYKLIREEHGTKLVNVFREMEYKLENKYLKS